MYYLIIKRLTYLFISLHLLSFDSVVLIRYCKYINMLFNLIIYQNEMKFSIINLKHLIYKDVQDFTLLQHPLQYVKDNYNCQNTTKTLML